MGSVGEILRVGNRGKCLKILVSSEKFAKLKKILGKTGGEILYIVVAQREGTIYSVFRGERGKM